MLKLWRLNHLIERFTSSRPCLLNYVTKVEIPVPCSSNKMDRKQFEPLMRKRQLKPFKQDFMISLFTGVFDADVIKYPTVLTPSEVTLLLQHATEIESLLNTVGDSVSIGNRTRAEVLAGLKEVRLFGLTVPQAYGGLEYSETHKQFLFENLKLNHNLRHLIANQENFCSKILISLGTELQKFKYLPKLALGELLGSAAFLEDTPFLDLISYATTSVINMTEKKVVLNGSKVCVTNADVADFFMVLSQAVPTEDVHEGYYYHFCIVDKNTTGVQISQSNCLDSYIRFPLYKVNFDNVVLPIENIVGSIDQSVFSVLKTTLASNQLSASAVCLATLRNLLHSAISYCNEKTKSTFPLTEYPMLQHNIAYLTMYTYAIESLVYLVAGRLDEFEKPDLYLESSATQALAVDYLRLGMNNYMEIVGNTCYLPSSPFQEALRVLHYYSYLDESNCNLKVIIGSKGIMAAAKTDTEMRTTVELLRLPNYLSVKDIMKYFTSDKKKLETYRSMLNYKDEIIADLQDETEFLAECFGFFRLAVEKHLVRYGNEAGHIENSLCTLGELAANLFALMACLSRSGVSSLMNQESFCDERNLTKMFAEYVKSIAERVYHDMKFDISAPFRYQGIGKRTFNYKRYPSPHPLTRGY